MVRAFKLVLIETRKFDPPIIALDRVERAVEVQVCQTCGSVYVDLDHRLGQCPLGHDQP